VNALKDLHQQLLSDLNECKCFSLDIDKSTDGADVSQMLVFVHFSKQFIIKEETLTLLTTVKHYQGCGLL
jgi:hypothetical protein